MVRYESLCAEPETTLTRIFEFFGLDPMRVELDFRSVEHHILGNSMRLGSSSDIRLDEKWRSQLTDADLNIFDRIAGKFNRRLGYE